MDRDKVPAPTELHSGVEGIGVQTSDVLFMVFFFFNGLMQARERDM